MRILLAFILLNLKVVSQVNYWQQAVDYQINVEVNDVKDHISGVEKLLYQNNSPDTLKEVYFHLYWNAFKKGSHAFEKQNALELTDSDFGEITIESITINNETHFIDVFESIGKVKLKKPILPGSILSLVRNATTNCACVRGYTKQILLLVFSKAK